MRAATFGLRRQCDGVQKVRFAHSKGAVYIEKRNLGFFPVRKRARRAEGKLVGVAGYEIIERLTGVGHAARQSGSGVGRAIRKSGLDGQQGDRR